MTHPNWKQTLTLAAAFALTGCTILVPNPWNAAGGVLAPPFGQSQPAPAGAPAGQPSTSAAPVASASPPPAAPANSPWAAPQVVPMMLMMAFHPMGLPIGGTELKPGEYIRWQLGDGSDREMPAFIERARLPDDGGNLVWRVKYGSMNGEMVTIEGAVSPNGQFARLRVKYNGETVARDLAFQNAQGVVMMGAQNITPEQIGAVDSGVEPVTIPAGTFSAHHYVFQRGGSAIEWWFSDSVPGGIVKLSGHSENQQQRNVNLIQVLAFGRDAVSEL